MRGEFVFTSYPEVSDTGEEDVEPYMTDNTNLPKEGGGLRHYTSSLWCRRI